MGTVASSGWDGGGEGRGGGLLHHRSSPLIWPLLPSSHNNSGISVINDTLGEINYINPPSCCW